jgi:hypothetical protein
MVGAFDEAPATMTDEGPFCHARGTDSLPGDLDSLPGDLPSG